MEQRAAALFRRLQDEITTALEALEPTARFRRDAWTRPEGGGGESRVLEGGELLEKGGVNFSEVWGPVPAAMAKQLGGEGATFWASGVSLVLHPRNPYVPTVHANFRMIRGGAERWFGGGADLTPSYPFDEDASHFHATLKAACDRHDAAYYPRFKKWCDEYFFLPHRGETRGVGGIFFDHLKPDATHDLDGLFAFVTSAGEAFLPAFLPIAERRRATPYTEREREFQQWRRGRYVEFNLIYDRGTHFGLQTNGRVESILMSLPPIARWKYDWHADPGTPEARLSDYLRPREWV